MFVGIDDFCNRWNFGHLWAMGEEALLQLAQDTNGVKKFIQSSCQLDIKEKVVSNSNSKQLGLALEIGYIK